ncbi:MAG: hypothetical protein U0694_21055 [Anaerolineae bacterium]
MDDMTHSNCCPMANGKSSRKHPAEPESGGGLPQQPALGTLTAGHA